MPDIAHANDWQTALVPVYLNTVEWVQPLHGTASVFTIHNLAYQGNLGAGAHFITGLGREHFNPHEFEHFGDFNPLKAALYHSTMLSTVSPTYAREIQTGEFGCGLDGVLAGPQRRPARHPQRHRRRRVGSQPRPPPAARASTATDMAGKAMCKAALQREMGLPERPDVPLFGVISRLTPQKGLDVLAHALEPLLRLDMQMVVLGSGDPEAEHFFSAMTARHGDKIRCFIGYDNGLSHRIEAGVGLLPHALALRALRPEPDVQPALRHLAHRAGHRRPGRHRRRTTTSRPAAGPGSCSRISPSTPWPTRSAGRCPPSTIGPQHMKAMRKLGMAQDFSWERAAAEYEQLYRDAYARRRKHPFPG